MMFIGKLNRKKTMPYNNITAHITCGARHTLYFIMHMNIVRSRIPTEFSESYMHIIYCIHSILKLTVHTLVRVENIPFISINIAKNECSE